MAYLRGQQSNAVVDDISRYQQLVMLVAADFLRLDATIPSEECSLDKCLCS